MIKTIIDSNKKWYRLDLKELIKYKDLFFTLAYRDFKVIYAQTFLGFIWAFLKPIITLSVFILVFGKGIEIDTGGIPYALFAICGLSAWTYFSNVITNSGSSIITAQSIIQKIYFPRLIIPLSKSLVGLIDFLITLILLFLLMLIFQYSPSYNFVYFPLYVIIIVISGSSIGIWLSALTIRYRDFQQLIPFFVRFGLFITPVAYPSEIIINKLPAWGKIIYFLNPMAGVIEGMRWSLLGGNIPNQYSYISFLVIILLFISSVFYFNKVEKIIADIV